MEDKIHNITLIIQACKAGNRAAQKRLYQLFFGYAMSIALRYSNQKAEAEDIMNDAFYKVFSRIDQYDVEYDFKKWFRSILINTAIDFHRKYKKLKITSTEEDMQPESEDNTGWKKLLYEDLLKEIQNLPPVYRIVFNLHAIDGFKHHEIAQQLNISVGTSRSNYARARKMLQNRLRNYPGVKKVSNGK